MRFAKKSLGQNFLIDKNIIKKIVNLVNVKNRNIIEIGPGKVLSGLIKRIDRNVKTNQVNSILDLKNSVNDWLKK